MYVYVCESKCLCVLYIDIFNNLIKSKIAHLLARHLSIGVLSRLRLHILIFCQDSNQQKKTLNDAMVTVKKAKSIAAIF